MHAETKQLLTTFQCELKRRFTSYQQGKQQGLPMVWDNMMQMLKERHEIDQIYS